ncbi:Yip1 domain family member 5 [Cricetulus griseus]
MSGFDNLNSGFYQTSYSIDEQSQQSYDYGGSGGPYSKQYAGYDYSQQGRFVPPDMMQAQQTYTGQIYQPTQAYPSTTPQPYYGDSFEEEPPLLEELGINFDHIWQKTLTVLHPLRVADGSIMNETDLAGPVVFCLAFGATLLLGIKNHVCENALEGLKKAPHRKVLSVDLGSVLLNRPWWPVVWMKGGPKADTLKQRAGLCTTQKLTFLNLAHTQTMSRLD